MKRLRPLVIALVLAGLCGTGSAQAQTNSASEGPWTAQLDLAATVGHKSSGSIGVEGGYKLSDDWQVFLETGRMANVTTSALEARGAIVAKAIGATATMKEPAAYFDMGLRYNLLPAGGWRPFALLGFGFARTTANPAFQIGGTDVTAQLASAYGVQLGLDLNGSVTKPFMTLGGGVNVPFMKRYFAEGSLRYGRIFPRTGVIPDDKGINTARLQLGVGVHF